MPLYQCGCCKFKCHYCDQEIKSEPVISIKEVTLSKDGIDEDVVVENWYCSEECRDEWES
jgi:hypothetical protein